MNIVKEGMNNIKYHMELGATETCAKRTMGASKGLDLMDVKGIPSIFIFETFFSNRSSEYAMDVGFGIIGVVKTNTKLLCKDSIEKITKYWPGGSYLVLKIIYMVPGNIPIIDIGYKYNAQKVLYLVDA